MSETIVAVDRLQGGLAIYFKDGANCFVTGQFLREQMRRHELGEIYVTESEWILADPDEASPST